MNAEKAYYILKSELIKEVSKEEKEILLEIIKKNPEYAYNYARYVIKGRFPEAEEYIKKDRYYADYYGKYIIGDGGYSFWDCKAALISLRESIKSAKLVEKTSSKDEIISALERLCS